MKNHLQPPTIDCSYLQLLVTPFTLFYMWTTVTDVAFVNIRNFNYNYHFSRSFVRQLWKSSTISSLFCHTDLNLSKVLSEPQSGTSPRELFSSVQFLPLIPGSATPNSRQLESLEWRSLTLPSPGWPVVQLHWFGELGDLVAAVETGRIRLKSCIY